MLRETAPKEVSLEAAAEDRQADEGCRRNVHHNRGKLFQTPRSRRPGMLDRQYGGGGPTSASDDE